MTPPEDTVEAGWPAIEAALGAGEAVEAARLLEDALGVPWTDPDAGAVRRAMIARLATDARFAEVAPGTWLAAGNVPRPPGRTRMPTVRVDHDALTLEEALDAWREVREEEGQAAFSHRVSFRDTQLGFIRLPGRRARLFPATGPARVTLVLEDGERAAWRTQDPTPMLYGLDGWLWQHDPGQHLRFQWWLTGAAAALAGPRPAGRRGVRGFGRDRGPGGGAGHGLAARRLA